MQLENLRQEHGRVNARLSLRFYKQFDEHKKPGIDAAMSDDLQAEASDPRNSVGRCQQPKISRPRLND